MLPLDRCRSHLPSGFSASEEALEKLREDLYGLAKLAIDAYEATGCGDPFRDLDPDQRESAEERAAICEFEAGMPRQEAERVALLRHRGDS